MECKHEWKEMDYHADWCKICGTLKWNQIPPNLPIFESPETEILKWLPLGISKLRLKEGDILVVKCEKNLHPKAQEAIISTMMNLIPHKVVVLDGGIELQVVRERRGM